MFTAMKAIPFMTVLIDEILFYGKDYCYPGHKWILKELGEKCDIKRCERTLCRWKKELIKSRYIIVKRRHKYSRRYGHINKSSLYRITARGLKLLIRINRITWDQYRKLVRKISDFPKGKKSPTPEEIRKSELTSIGAIISEGFLDTG